MGNDFTYLDQYTMGPAYNEFGYNEHLVVEIRFLCIKLIDCNVKKFGYNEQPLITSSSLCIFLLVTNPTQNLDKTSGGSRIYHVRAPPITRPTTPPKKKTA